MSEPAAPVYRTTWLWIVLAVFLTIGTAASAFVVYGVAGLLGGQLFPAIPIAVGGAFVALVSMLLITGILYRVDRLRGVPHREVRLFE